MRPWARCRDSVRRGPWLLSSSSRQARSCDGFRTDRTVRCRQTDLPLVRRVLREDQTPRESYCARPTPGLGKRRCGSLLRLHPVRFRPRGRLVHGCEWSIGIEISHHHLLLPLCRGAWGDHRPGGTDQNLWLLGRFRMPVSGWPKDGPKGRQAEDRYVIKRTPFVALLLAQMGQEILLPRINSRGLRKIYQMKNTCARGFSTNVKGAEAVAHCSYCRG